MIKYILRSVTFLILLVPSIAMALSLILFGGSVFQRVKNSPTVQINSQQWNNYVTDRQTRLAGIYGARLADNRFVLDHTWNFSLGLSGLYTDFRKIGGTEYPFSNSGVFDSLGYKFKVQSYALFLDSRFIYTDYLLQPYVGLGLGAAVNNANHYNEFTTPNSGGAAPVPNGFESHTRASFAYKADIGLRLPLINTTANAFFIGLEYGWLNLGRAQLGRMPAQTTSSHLTVKRLATQYALLTLEYSNGV